jgi:hypothetical protein
MPDENRDKEQKDLHQKDLPEEIILPYVTLDWTEEQLENLAKIASSDAAQPTEALIRLMKEDAQRR